MSITIHIPTAFRRFTAGESKLRCEAANSDLEGLLTHITQSAPQLASQIQDEARKLRRFVNVYVNDEDIRFLEKGWKLADGDEVFLVPSIAGGCGTREYRVRKGILRLRRFDGEAVEPASLRMTVCL